LGKTVSILVRGSNRLVLDEAHRSLHDALCVVRALVKQKFMLIGGGAPEIELALRLTEAAEKMGGIHGFCIKEYAKALEVIPYTLAENAGLHPIGIVTELRKQHAEKKSTAGINVKLVCITICIHPAPFI
jgi:T-complex protein 1 subunit delta